jgi:predicted enzyme related to lactoylglutathione lyase
MAAVPAPPALMSMAKKSARKSSKSSKSTRPAAKKTARKAVPKSRSRKAERRHEPTQGLWGWITHTELASADPDATKAWAQKALGWKFNPSFPMEDGEMYHLFAYSDQGGGGIRRSNPPEVPGSIPYLHVKDCQQAFDKAIAAGAEEMVPPTKVMEGVVTAIVRAPGGVAIGFSGGK